MGYSEERGVTGPWDNCLVKLQQDNMVAANVQEIVRKRIETNRRSCAEGSWTAENFNYLPNGVILVASRQYNPLIANAKEARLAHERHREYFLPAQTSDELRDIAEADAAKPPEARRVFRLDRNESFIVTLPNLPHDDFMRFLAKDDIGPYTELLKSQGLRGMRIQVLSRDYVLRQREAFAKAMWFDDIQSGFVGNTDLTHYNPGRLYGVPWQEVVLE